MRVPGLRYIYRRARASARRLQFVSCVRENARARRLTVCELCARARDAWQLASCYSLTPTDLSAVV
jgi:hypothetical protein